MSELKPCPFCGGEAHFVEVGFQDKDDIISPYVICHNCGASTAWYEGKKEAKDAWNRRATMNNELRLCLITYETRVRREKGFKTITEAVRGHFHRWEDVSKIIPPSNIIGGHEGGELKQTLAIVELEDGTVKEVYPTQIRFVSKEEWLKVEQ